jgi:pilus assembly protein CpaC
MRKLFFGLLFITTFITILPFNGYAVSDSEEEINLYIGQAKVISVSSPKRIAVGNPAIADVANVSKSELTISPKAAGSTTLIVWDNFGEQSYRLRVFTEDTSDIKRRVDNMLVKLNLPDVYTKAEDEEGKVLLLGQVKYAKDKERIATALAQIKDKTIDLIDVKADEGVIEIDVQVLELYKGVENKLGFEWPSTLTLSEVVGSSVATAAAGAGSWGKLFQLGHINRTAFDLTLDLLVKEGSARILSHPRISCLSGKEAKLLVGGQVPVISGTTTAGPAGSTTATASGGTIEYKDYGIVLSVKPQIDDKGRVHLNLEVEVSEVGDLIQTQNAAAYTFTKRSATTELILNDGQTVGMGGLIKQRTDEELQKFPWLGDIPVLGVFFRHKNYYKGKTGLARNQDVDLFIILTPRISSQGKSQKELKSSLSPIPSVSDDDIRDPILKYSKIVQKKILDKLTYPVQAKEAGFQGTVRLSLNLSYQGGLLNLKLKDSSNYRILDANAINTAQKAGPYPPFPPTIKDKEIWVDIPITYQLE